MVRQGDLINTRALIAVAVAFLITAVVVGCGRGPGNIDERDGERGAATNEDTTAPEGDRSVSETSQEPVGLDVKVVSPGKRYVLAGFGEGSLWATELATCNDTASASSSAGSASVSSGTCAGPGKTLLKRLEPQSGEEVAAIPLSFSEVTEVAFGAGSVWVTDATYLPGPVSDLVPGGVVYRIDPRTSRVVDQIRVIDTPSGLTFGHGSVWVTSAPYGIVSRIDPETDKVVAKIEVGRGAVDIVADEVSEAVWVAGVYLPKDYAGRDNPKYSEDRKLSRIDPATNRVVAEIPIRAGSPDGGVDNVGVGEGAVWAQSASELLKVDPATNEVTATVPLGGYASHLAIYGGAVWATVQGSGMATVQGSGIQLVRVDPRTEQVVASEDIGPVSKGGYGRLAAGRGYVWFASGDGLARVAP